MAPSRAYIPSAALLRALSRPLPPRCPFALRSTTIRTLRSQTPGAQPGAKGRARLFKKLGLKPHEPPTDHDLGGVGKSRIESIEYYEQDSAGKEVLIDRVANKQDLERIDNLQRMYEESQKDPNYDTAELYKASIDSIASNPNFADLRDELESMKRSRSMISTDIPEQEMKKIDREASASIRMEIHDNLQELIDDAEMADLKEELIEVQRRLPEIEGTLAASPEWTAVLARLEEKLANHEAYQQKVASQVEDGDLNPTNEILVPEGVVPPELKDMQFEKAEDVNALIKQMQEVLTAMGGDPEVEKELEDLMNEDPVETLAQDDQHRAELAFQSLADQLSEFKDAPPPEELEDANVSPELQAKVDKILEDPNLMEKLALIKDLIQKTKNDITYMGPSAPDPLNLDQSETTTLRTRLKIAENDPEHIAALRRLRVNLLPPFNVSPALRSLNEALRLSYVGANDDVRRVLWRAYFKARTIPTLLQNIPDDAWDMLWYSQAVTWGSNQNRQNHLRILLQDLASVGKNGPPTHPKSLAGQEEVHLD
ncbi:hypothetical protein BDV96DRAFT_497816 [Lophiotrema nucula]|uniref:Uncharacterized protein n=1 Tax=Lophiotrema nucula TaxID=690887 RepID=A0A6A5YYZ0_9PLEO|nr:hypothetical protein BDV96DRAFT_497816 [Lophiotrema nucula]